jgi:hypothetical protein
MKISGHRNSRKLSALVASIAVMAGASACSSGTGSTGSGAGPTSKASASASSSPSPITPATTRAAPSSSASAAKSVAPVPVESNPPGDIPDNLAFVKYTNKPGGYAFTHPEGWAQTGRGNRVRFTDKLNGVTVDSLQASQVPSVASARATDVPRLRKSTPAFQLRDVSAVTVPGGQGVHIVFRRNSDPDPVSGKIYRDEVEEYLVFSSGRLVRMDLYGPVGADNVDAYRTMSQSLSIR